MGDGIAAGCRSVYCRALTSYCLIEIQPGDFLRVWLWNLFDIGCGISSSPAMGIGIHWHWHLSALALADIPGAQPFWLEDLHLQ